MFVELVIVEERQRAEALSDALLTVGALSASIEDADAGSADEQPLYGEPGMATPSATWNRSRVVALFDGAADVSQALRAALDEAGIADLPSFERHEIADADWVGLTQSQFDPIGIGERLWIVPSWHAVPAAALAPDAVVIRLDPGMAFGTGDHPTTRLCLAWLDANVRGGETVIDYGCGSGILAIAAIKLGAAAVAGTDIDDQAITAARANAADNDVRVDFVSSARFAGEPVELVMANILSNPLKVLAPLLTSLVAPGGRLVLSGILERQWPEVAAIYAPAIALRVWRVDEGWVCLEGKRVDGPAAVAGEV